MGPLAVRTDGQGRGVGTRIVMAGVEWLKARGATTIGLETMPRTIENIGFYSRLGFQPGPLTISLGTAPVQGPATGAVLLGPASGESRAGLLAAMRLLSDRVAPGVDFSRECELTVGQKLGDVAVL